MHTPTVRATAYVLAHVPDLVRYGSKPEREIRKDPAVEQLIAEHLRPFEAARDYAPNQVYIGGMSPEELRDLPQPWWQANGVHRPARYAMGEIVPQDLFYAYMKVGDDFDLIWLDEAFVAEVAPKLAAHALVHDSDVEKLGGGVSTDRLEQAVAAGALPLTDGGRLVGCVRPGHDEDPSLIPEILLENFACKASGMLSMRHLFTQAGLGVAPDDIEYVLNSGEEAVGDRYQRGAGNLAKAMAETAGCLRATGGDLKAFCCSPVHSIVMAGGLVKAGVFRHMLVVGGGSLSKLGMKYQGHVKHGMPVLEDVLGAFTFLVSPGDDDSPEIRLDCVGRHDVKSGSSPQAIAEALIQEPLGRAGLSFTDIDKYATELHNPEVTEPAGSGNVPLTNYRMIAGLAALNGEIERTALNDFVDARGMLGFSPTQGHIASAVPYLGHAIEAMRAGRLQRAFFVGKGSLFLAKMTTLSDGMSFLLERR